jgi:hypothetical protein
MTTTVTYSVVGNASAFAPDLVINNILQPTDKVPLMNTVYKKFTQLLDEAASFCPALPPIQGTRGYKSNLHAAIFEFDTVKHLTSSTGMELRITLQNDIPYIGEHCTVSFRCLSDNEIILT